MNWKAPYSPLSLLVSIFKDGASRLEVAFKHNFFLHAEAWLQSFGGLQTEHEMLCLHSLLLGSTQRLLNWRAPWGVHGHPQEWRG